MLFAVSGPRIEAEKALERVTADRGHPVDMLRVGDAVLCVWSSDARARIDRASGSAIEGHCEIDPPRAWTTATLRAARGDFALIAATAGGLLLGGGRGGGNRPVYAARSGDVNVASTRLEALVAALPGLPALNMAFVAQSLLLEPHLDPTATPYVGVRRVLPTQSWLLEGCAVRRESAFGPLRDPALRAKGPELAAMLRDALEGALGRAINGARRIAIAASGGLDSSALVALACGLARKGLLDSEPSLYYWEFPTSPQPHVPWLGDDKPYLRSLERGLKLKANPVFPAEASAEFRRHLIIDSKPCFFPVVPLWTTLARRARSAGAEVLVSGAGGDNVVNGQPGLLSDLVRRGRPIHALSRAVRLRGPMLGGTAWRVREYVLGPLVGRVVPERLKRDRRERLLRRRYPWAGPRLRKHIADVAGVHGPQRSSLDWSPAERYEAFLTMPFFEDLYPIRAQVEAVAGHVQRDPYIDDEFLRFVATLPPLALLHGDYLRGLLREAMRGLIPEDVRLRQSKAAMSPAIVDMLAPIGGFDVVRDLADVRMAADLGLVEPRAFREHFDALAARPLEIGGLDRWAVLATEAFLRAYAGERGVVS